MKGKPAPKISTEQLCRDYYDSQIFKTNGDFELIVYAEILKVDFSAKEIDTEIFICELMALNIELFGLGWLDHNYPGEQGPECTEIKFTKSYLEQMGESEIWKAAGFYNETIFQARTAQKISRDWSVSRDAGYYEGDFLFSETTGEKLIEDSIRDYYDKRLADKECASRLANRVLSVDAWREGIMILQQLSSTFAQRLNFSPNIEALLLLQKLTVGLYKNAKDYINAVIDYGSWELAQKAAIDLSQSLLEAGRELLEKQKRSDKPDLP